eukprot:COSAG03_NODE_22_length_20538_cov_27.667286_5_plen_64_part_00
MGSTVGLPITAALGLSTARKPRGCNRTSTAILLRKTIDRKIKEKMWNLHSLGKTVVSCFAAVR